MFFSPLEQFEIISLFNLTMNSIDFSFTNSSLLIVFAFFFVFIGIRLLSQGTGGFIVPNRWQSLVESLYGFIGNMVFENMGKKGQEFFPFIFALFSFLLLCNFIGLVPYSFTVTSHLVITFGFSLVVWVGKLFIGFNYHGIKFFGVLLPNGLPVAIIPFFVAVEFLSFIIPLFALGVRLFANIIAGHILLKVFVGFCWSIIMAGGLLFLAHFVPIAVLFLLLFLETAVAAIQAYIFTMLACLIIGDAVKGGHLFSYFFFLSLVAQW